MAVSSVRTCRNVRAHVSYLALGTGGKRASHLRAGTHRMAGVYCDASSLEEFVTVAQSVNRKVKARQYVVSFPLSDLDPTKADDRQRGYDVLMDVVDRMNQEEKAPTLLVMHTDGEGHDGCGGKLHGHVVRINENLETGGCLKRFRTHREVSAVADQVMRENDLSVIQREGVAGERKETQLDVWTTRRGVLVEEGRTFDAVLWDRCQAAAQSSGVRDWDGYVAELDRQGVEVVQTERQVKGQTVTGVTYTMLDETQGPQRARKRRRKASKLDPMLTREGMGRFLEEKQAQSVVTTPAPAAEEFDLEEVLRRNKARYQQQEPAQQRPVTIGLRPDPERDARRAAELQRWLDGIMRDEPAEREPHQPEPVPQVAEPSPPVEPEVEPAEHVELEAEVVQEAAPVVRDLSEERPRVSQNARPKMSQKKREELRRKFDDIDRATRRKNARPSQKVHFSKKVEKDREIDQDGPDFG